jgi:predicted ATPase
MGTTFVQTYFFTLIAGAWLRVGDPAEALVTVEQGIRAAQATGEHFFTAELFRLAGRTRLALEGQDSAAAEANLHDALADARSRGARLWELRAARDLAHLWAEQGERRKARDLLAPVYDWFTEGFDPADLKDAKTLLDELA